MKTWKKILLLVGILLLALGVSVVKIARTRGENFIPTVSFGTSGSFGYDQKGYTVCTDGEESFAAKDVRRGLRAQGSAGRGPSGACRACC